MRNRFRPHPQLPIPLWLTTIHTLHFSYLYQDVKPDIVEVVVVMVYFVRYNDSFFAMGHRAMGYYNGGVSSAVIVT